MKQIFILGLFLIYTNIGKSQSFQNLQEIDLGNGKSVLYDQNISEVLNVVDETGIVSVLKTKISRFAYLDYVVEFNPGPSDDPSFMIYCLENNQKTPIINLPGEQLVVPGNGSIYISGRTNNMFLKRQKFELINNALEEIEQPAYYVGMQTKTLKTIEIFADLEQTTRVAVVPKNYKIEVVLNQGEYYLLKTPFGLLGWIRLDPMKMLTEPVIEGLFYDGD